jgi:hypothetical protein
MLGFVSFNSLLDGPVVPPTLACPAEARSAVPPRTW